MPFLLENDTRRNIGYAGSNPLRREFVEHIVGDEASVIALGGGREIHSSHPLLVAKEKIRHAQHQDQSASYCYVAFDVLTAVPTQGEYGTVYQILGKPKDEEAVQRMFGLMSNNDPYPYWIRAASALTCGGEQKAACHAAAILLDPQSLSWLAGNSGFTTYTEYVSMFGYQFGHKDHPTDFAGGFSLEALLAMNCVAAINDIPIHQQGFEVEAQRALFLARVGASHTIFEGLIHDNPMKHIIAFSHHQDTLELLKKFSDAI